MTLAETVSRFAYTHRERKRERMWTRMFALESWLKQGGKCAYCREPMKRDDITGDHVDPIVSGGSTRRENIKAACRPCNMAKGHLSETAFLKAIKSPRPGDSIHIWLAWSRRRIWLRTERACKRIMEAVS
jgi:5-methylcytosine-specific restriction endonuclease McrA